MKILIWKCRPLVKQVEDIVHKRDSAKTGVVYNIPRNIAKYSKPLPYFMKYASSYYSGMKDLAKTSTNMNRLCWEIEKWEKATIRHKHKFKDFNYKIMMDESIPIDQEKVDAISKIFVEYNKDMGELASHQFKFNNYQKYRNWIAEYYPTLTQEEIIGFKFNWQYYFELYREKCSKICPNQKELANIAIYVCYEVFPKKEKNFIWRIASEGILKNLELNKQDIYLPTLDNNGKYEYLGRYYNMEKLETND